MLSEEKKTINDLVPADNIQVHYLRRKILVLFNLSKNVIKKIVYK